MITKYITARGDKLYELVDIVNKLIKSGWQPLGAPFQYSEFDDGSGIKFCQAMVTDKEQP